VGSFRFVVVSLSVSSLSASFSSASPLSSYSNDNAAAINNQRQQLKMAPAWQHRQQWRNDNPARKSVMAIINNVWQITIGIKWRKST